LYADELEMCKRHFERIAAEVAGGYYAFGRANAVNSMTTFFQYIEKRVEPILSVSNVSKFSVIYASTTIATTNVEGYLLGKKGCQIYVTVGSNVFTVGECCILRGEAGSAVTHYIDVAARL
jgi:hypothetical protein